MLQRKQTYSSQKNFDSPKDSKTLKFDVCKTKSSETFSQKKSSTARKQSDNQALKRCIIKKEAISCPASARKPRDKQEKKTSTRHLKAMESAIKNLEKKFKAYEAGDHLIDAHSSNEDISHNFKLNDDANSENSESLNVIFDETHICNSNSETSAESMMESGYQTNSDNPNLHVAIESEKEEANNLKVCNSNTQINKGEQTPNLRNVFLEILESNSQVCKIAENFPEYYKEHKHMVTDEAIIEEIKKTVEKEIKIEEQLTKYLKMQTKKEVYDANSDCHMSTLDVKNLNESLAFVKENLTSIKYDINDFKENCWKKIEAKVSKTEFNDTTAALKSKLTSLERKMYAETRQLKQEVSKNRDKLKREDYCGIRSFPIWPFVAFIGAYSIMYYGNKT